ncbi:MAG: hypothetical protein ACYC3X_08115 [Pirellulaceae bacterium]
MTDVPSHDRVLATVLAQGGVKFMHIGCNWPSGYVKYPPLFWWEGPDGSRVLTMYSCVKVRMGSMEDFADAIIAENADLPVVTGEAPDTWIHGIMSDPRGVRTARNINPLLAAVAEGKGGELPVERTGLRVSRPGILVTAFGTNPDGGGTLLRLWEMGGRSGSCQVTLPEGIQATSLQPVDLRGRPVGETIKVTQDVIEVHAKAFAPMSFLIE